MIPPQAVPGYVHAVTQVGDGLDQDLSSVQADTGDPDVKKSESFNLTLWKAGVLLIDG